MLETYLRHVFDRLVAIGMNERSARGAVRYVRQTIQQSIADGLSERDAIARHRHHDLSGILEGARNEVIATGIMRVPVRRVPVIPPPPPSRERRLMDTIEALAQLELQLIAQENPGGYIATSQQAAQSQVIPLIRRYYTLSAEGVIRMIPIVGDLIDIGEAIVGRDAFSGEELPEWQRGLSGGLGILGLIPIAGRVVRGISGGVRSVGSGLRSVARRLRVAAAALEAQMQRLSRFANRSRQLRRVIEAFERGLPVRSLDVSILREYVEEVLRFIRLGSERTLEAVRHLGRQVANFVHSTRGSVVQIVDHAGQMRIFRCSGS